MLCGGIGTFYLHLCNRMKAHRGQIFTADTRTGFPWITALHVCMGTCGCRRGFTVYLCMCVSDFFHIHLSGAH